MFRKSILTIAAAAILAASCFASASYASDWGFGGRAFHDNRGHGYNNKHHDHRHDRDFHKRYGGFRYCKNVPIWGGKHGDRVVAFRQVCRR